MERVSLTTLAKEGLGLFAVGVVPASDAVVVGVDAILEAGVIGFAVGPGRAVERLSADPSENVVAIKVGGADPVSGLVAERRQRVVLHDFGGKHG